MALHVAYYTRALLQYVDHVDHIFRYNKKFIIYYNYNYTMKILLFITITITIIQ